MSITSLSRRLWVPLALVIATTALLSNPPSLWPRSARIELTSTPAGARVWVRGPADVEFQPVTSSTPCWIDLTSLGTVAVRFERDGFRPREHALELRYGPPTLLSTQLEPLAGRIRVESEPSGVAVDVRQTHTHEVVLHSGAFVNGDPVFWTELGVTPLVSDWIPTGVWIVRLRVSGYATAFESIRVSDGGTVILDVALTSISGVLDLRSTPVGAEVSVRPSGDDGTWTHFGTTPIEEGTLPGAWDVRFQKSGYRPIIRSLRIEEQSRGTLAVQLISMSGRIHVGSVPSGASVEARRAGTRDQWVHLGSTPFTSRDLTIGEWAVRTTLEDRVSDIRVVRVEDGQIRNIEVELDDLSVPPGYVVIQMESVANLTLNGRIVRTRVESAILTVPAGTTHTIAARAERGSRSWKDVRVASGDTLVIGRVRLEPAMLRVFCIPAVSVGVMVDGIFVGYTPYAGSLSAGPHVIGIQPGHHVVSDVDVTGKLTTPALIQKSIRVPPVALIDATDAAAIQVRFVLD